MVENLTKFKSKGEEKVFNTTLSIAIASSNLIVSNNYNLQKLGCPKILYADFIIFDLEHNPLCVIEVNGEQHYNFYGYFQNPRQQANDEYKKEWCENHSILFCIMPYIKGKLYYDYPYYDLLPWDLGQEPIENMLLWLDKELKQGTSYNEIKKFL